ncbi:MAG: hypothetical protein AB1746_09885 [Candidatus Zixiibacteriota bacterium]
MNGLDLFGKVIKQSICINDLIDSKTDKEFKLKFRSLFSSPLAKSERGIVYMWLTDKGIPRMHGSSNVIYIGKTINTLYERLHRWAEVEGSELNWIRYKYIIDNFGPIKIMLGKTGNPREAEKKMLKIYFEEHLEYPPMNAGG